MQFKIDLGRAQHLPAHAFRYDPELEDVRSILIDVCDALAEMASAELLISGFGQDAWPVDVRTDLGVLLEQLPRALRAIESRAPFALDFYEQGIERAVHFEPEDDRYVARCESRSEWRPDPAVEVIDRSALRSMLLEIRDQFLTFLSRSAPQLASHPWISAWAGVEPTSVSRHEDAAQFIESVQEPKLRAVLEYALTTVLVRRGMSPSVHAASELDLRYFLEAVKAMFEDEAVIRTIIDGDHESLRWW